MRRHAINKIVPQRMADQSNLDLYAYTFAEAYDQLRRACPNGDLHIHLYIDEEKNEPAADKRVFRTGDAAGK